ncbi:MAG: hypothetical protein KDA84_11050, partial [Planctomycetaceae bacterium]|nr:hypothetical protein [Planctomycetaceae bacterium]
MAKSPRFVTACVCIIFVFFVPSLTFGDTPDELEFEHLRELLSITGDVGDTIPLVNLVGKKVGL